MKKLFELLIRWPNLLLYYVKVSWSFDFIIRYSLLGMLYIVNALFLGRLERIINKIHPIFYKTFVFKTKFWTYIGKTVNHRTVLSPDYEPALKKVIDENYNKYKDEERIFIDIGAHIWRYAIELTKNYGYFTYSFEPSPETYKILKCNVILSDIENKINIFNYALGNQNTEMMFDYNWDNDASSKIIQDINNESKWIKVPVRIFDTLNLDLDPQKVKLIIMDVEWFEYQVLQGMSVFFHEAKNLDCIIEIMDDQKEKKQTINFMKDIWYQARKIDDNNYHFWK